MGQNINMMRIQLFAAFITFLVGQISFGQIPKDAWDVADSLTVRLQPSAFPSLPKNIVSFLEKGGYTIPQCWSDTVSHNVIIGSFKKDGQQDWAVLASKNRVSTILVFWNGSDKDTAMIGQMSDNVFLQDVGQNRIGFSRVISAVDSSLILRYYDLFGGRKPPPIEHEGIDDAFIGKGSEIYYYYKGKWLSLTGAD